RFDPSDEEIDHARAQADKTAEPPRPLWLTLDAGSLPAGAIEELKRIFEDFPGDCEVVLEMHTRSGPRRLRLGDGYRVAARNAGLKAELDRLLVAARPVAVPV
ncbi:MAG TPA: hypothetical protein VES79_12750, partial [Solirubrobacteraceae bacterium]|nr:hypothetical protein [Solirubrobacteraceae bacterium]